MPVQTFYMQDDIPEEHRAAALETKDGKFAVFLEPDTSGLTSALQKEREARKAEEKVRKEKEARLRELELEAKARDGGLTSEKLKDIRAQVEAEYAPWKEKATALEQRVRALTLDSVVKAKMGDFVDVDAAWKLFGDEFDLTEDGQPIVKAEPGKALDRHLADLKARHPYLVRGTQAAGGGAAGNVTGAGARATGDNVFAWSATQRAEYIRANGPEAYAKLLDASAVQSVTKKQAA